MFPRPGPATAERRPTSSAPPRLFHEGLDAPAVGPLPFDSPLAVCLRRDARETTLWSEDRIRLRVNATARLGVASIGVPRLGSQRLLRHPRWRLRREARRRLTALRPQVKMRRMTNEAREIEKKALTLSAAEREALANHLFQSVHNKDLNEIDAAWLSVAEERWAEYNAHPETGVEKKDFFAQIRDTFGWK